MRSLVSSISRHSLRYSSWLISVPFFISSSAAFFACCNAANLSLLADICLPKSSCFWARIVVFPGSSLSRRVTSLSSFFTALIGLFSFVSPFSRPSVFPSISRVKPFTLAAKMEPPPFRKRLHSALSTDHLLHRYPKNLLMSACVALIGHL